MLSNSLKVAGVIVLPVAVLFVGCGKASTPSGAVKPTAIGENPVDTVQNESGGGGEHSKAIAAALAKLSPEDRTLAEKQKTCPVSGEQLGLMGTPVKLDVKNQAVFICCDGCREKLLANPDEYLAKLNK